MLYHVEKTKANKLIATWILWKYCMWPINVWAINLHMAYNGSQKWTQGQNHLIVWKKFGDYKKHCPGKVGKGTCCKHW